MIATPGSPQRVGARGHPGKEGNVRVAIATDGLSVFVEGRVLAELATRGVAALISVFLDREGYLLHHAFGPELAFLEEGVLRFTCRGRWVEARVLDPEGLLREALLRLL